MSNHREEKDHFDLLPFIAILLCMIGCLLLVTMSVASLSLGPSAGEGWIPSEKSNEVSKIPILIEWDGSNAVVHEKQNLRALSWTAPKFISLGGLTFMAGGDTNKPKTSFDLFLDELARENSTHYALFAIRPSGFSNFNYFVTDFRGKEIDVGYEPIAQSKPVRLFDRNKAK